MILTAQSREQLEKPSVRTVPERDARRGRKVLVCGGRDLNLTFDEINDGIGGICIDIPARIIHGGVGGVDRSAAAWATKYDVPQVLYEAEYTTDWNNFGSTAAEKVIQCMFDREEPDIVVAFWDGRSHGTGNVIHIAINAGVPVYIKPSVPA